MTASVSLSAEQHGADPEDGRAGQGEPAQRPVRAAASRIAAIGGTRAARSAGISAAATVNPTPTRSVAITTYGL